MQKRQFLFFQAANDHDLTPSKTLSQAMAEMKKPYEVKIYPSCGSSPQEAHTLRLFWSHRVGERCFPVTRAALPKPVAWLAPGDCGPGIFAVAKQVQLLQPAFDDAGPGELLFGKGPAATAHFFADRWIIR